MKVTTVLFLSMTVLMGSQQVSGGCNSHIPPKIAPSLDCVPHLNGTCLGEEVKCLRSNLLNQPQLSNLTGIWDTSDTFFNPEINIIRITYHNESHTPCPWTYVAEQDINRYPQYIQTVTCSSSTCYNSEGVKEGGLCACTEVNYTMPILRRIKCNSDGQQWEITSTIVNVACVPRFFDED